MLASPLESLRINRRSMSVISPLRRYVTTGNLAIVLFVTLAVLGTIRGKETETTKTALANPPRAKLSSITSAFHRTRLFLLLLYPSSDDGEDHRQVNHQPQPNSMKLALRSFLVKVTLLIATPTLCLGGSTYAQPRGSSVLSPGPVRPSGLDYRIEAPRGYLEVYSDGKVVKKVENHISRSDELPEIVALPVGSYIIEARSDKDGYVRVAVVIKAGHRTTLNLESRQHDTLTRLARAISSGEKSRE